MKRLLLRNIALLMALLCMLLPLGGAQAESAEGARVVRVGWYDVPGIMHQDAHGNRSGYCYDYLQEIARYASVQYTYVQGSWQENLDRMRRGEIDVMVYVQYTDERASYMDYMTQSMGQSYCVFTALDANTAIVPGDSATYQGARIGVIAGSTQITQTQQKMAKDGFTAELVQYDEIDQLIGALERGEVDLVAHSSFRILTEHERVIEKFAPERFYLTVAKEQTALLDQLKQATEYLRINDSSLMARLTQRYFADSVVSSLMLDDQDKALLAAMGTLRVVVPPEDGYVSWTAGEEQRGIVQAIAQRVADSLGVPLGYTEVWHWEDVQAALQSASDTTLTANYGYDYAQAAEDGVELTNPYMTCSYYRVVRSGWDQAAEDTRPIALPRTLAFLRSDFETLSGGKTIAWYDATTQCLDAVVQGEVQYAFVDSLTADYVLADPCFLDLSSELVDVHASVCFAVSGPEAHAVALMVSRALDAIGTATLNDLVDQNKPYRVVDPTLIQMVQQRPLLLVGAILLVAAALVALAMSFYHVRLARERQRTVDYEEILSVKRHLEESQASMQAAIDNAHMMYFEYFPEEHACLEYNGRERFGVTERMENYPESWFALHITQPAYEPVLRDAFRQIDEGAEHAACDVVNRVEGKDCWHRYNMTGIYDTENRRVKVVCTALDITQQMEAEEHYRRQMEAVMQTDQDTLATFHMNMTDNWCGEGRGSHPMVRELMRADTVDAFFSRMDEIIAPEDWARYRDLFSRRSLLDAWRHGSSEVELTHHTKFGDGTYHWVRTAVRMFENPSDGKVEGVLWADNVDGEMMEEQIVQHLTNEEYDFLAIIDIAAATFTVTNVRKDKPAPLVHESPIYQVDVDYYVDMLVVAEDRTRVAEELALRNIIDQLDHESTYCVMLREYEEDRVVYKQQRYSYLDASRRQIIMRKLDVTDTYLKEQEQVRVLERALKAAESANHAKTDFLSRMSHDMRTPMNGIIGLAELSRDEQDVAVLRENIRRIEESGGYLLSLINDTLDMNKIESNKIVLYPEPVNSSDFIGNIADMIRIDADAKQVRFAVQQIDIRQGTMVKLDKVRAKQVLMNLLSNAVKFTPEGGFVELIIEGLSREKDLVHLRVIVRDSGIGMSEQFMASQLYQPFAQEQTAVTSSYVGSGLGLAIVKRLVEMMGGTIDVKSRLGHGTEFTILIAVETLPDAVTPGGAQPHARTGSLHGKKALLVEDHPLNVEIARRMLEKVGCTVTVAVNGALGVAAFARSQPGDYDVILMDVRMPVMNGIDATKAIRQMTREDARTIPIIAMTANAFEEDVQQTRAAGMDAHLAKPISPQHLYDTLLDFLCNG